MTKRYKSDIHRSVHLMMAGMKSVGGIDKTTMREFDELCLTKVEAPDKVSAALMGHKYHRPRYGLGPSLEQKREWLQRIAFSPPSRV